MPGIYNWTSGLQVSLHGYSVATLTDYSNKTSLNIPHYLLQMLPPPPITAIVLSLSLLIPLLFLSRLLSDVYISAGRQIE